MMEIQPDYSVRAEQIEFDRSNGSNSVKKVRQRKPWVYKSDYDRLETENEFLKRVAVIGWCAFATAVFGLLIVLSSGV